MINNKHYKKNKTQTRKNKTNITSSIKLIQSGGGWHYHVRKGIKEASHHYRTQNKLYYISILTSLKYLRMFRNRKRLDTIISELDTRLKEILNLDLSRVSSQDYSKLQKNTRLMFLKQDLIGDSKYNILLDNLRSGKLDQDLKKFYQEFSYSKVTDNTEYKLFRESANKNNTKSNTIMNNNTVNDIKQLNTLSKNESNNLESKLKQKYKSKYKKKYKDKYRKKYKKSKQKHRLKNKSQRSKSSS